MFYKFPSTPYIEVDSTVKRNDKILLQKEVSNLLCNEIIIEEKIDGANLVISFDSNGQIKLQNRGEYIIAPYLGQWKKLPDWLIKYEDNIFDVITNEYILFGEWCYMKHSVYYDNLPDWFVGFDIFDIRKEKFLSVNRRNEMFTKMGIIPVPQLGKGKYSIEELSKFLKISKYGKELCKGIYILDNKEYLEYRAKMVRNEFRQNIGEHWSKGILQCNKLGNN